MNNNLYAQFYENGLNSGERFNFQEVKYWGERGGCPTPGCRGVGHIKGEKFSSHHTASACPYAPQNVESTNLLPDRLKVSGFHQLPPGQVHR